MAESMFTYRGGPRSRSVAGQPTGYGGAPVGSPGQTALQAFQQAAVPQALGGGQSITSAPAATQPQRPAPAPASTSPTAPMPMPAPRAPGATTPMFKPSFALPNTVSSRYVGSLTAPQKAAATPTYQSPGQQALGSGVGVREANGEQRTAEEDRASAWYNEYLKWKEKNPNYTGQFSDWYNDPKLRTISEDTANTILAEQERQAEPTITTDASGNVVINGLPITDPQAQYAEESTPAQKALDEANRTSLEQLNQAKRQIDANQILDALAKAGEQAMRGGMSGFGLGEQGIVQQNAQKQQLMATAQRTADLLSIASQQQVQDQAAYDRMNAFFQSLGEEGRGAMARAQRNKQIFEEISALQEGGVTPEEQAQIAQLATEYAANDALNKELIAKQTKINDGSATDVFNDNGQFNSEKYGGDPKGKNVTRDYEEAERQIDQTTDDLERYFVTLRSRFGQDMGDYESASEAAEKVINELVDRAQNGDPVSTKVLRNVGLGAAITGGYEGDDLLDLIDRAMDRIWDRVTAGGGEYDYFGGQSNQPPVPPSLVWLFEKRGGPPPTSSQV